MASVAGPWRASWTGGVASSNACSGRLAAKLARPVVRPGLVPIAGPRIGLERVRPALGYVGLGGALKARQWGAQEPERRSPRRR